MAMTKTQVMKLLRENQNERGIAHWKKRGSKKVKSFGIGLTQLRKLAKQIGRDHKLAMQLWNSDVYDAKVVAFDKMTGKEVWRALSSGSAPGPRGPRDWPVVWNSSAWGGRCRLE